MNQQCYGNPGRFKRGDLWNQVQQRLASNKQGTKTKAHAANPSLLAGKLQDELGRRLIPSHARKGNKRYRYYVTPVDEPGEADQSHPTIEGPASPEQKRGDQCYFWLGRRHVTVVLGHWPRIAAQAERLNGLVARFHEAVIIGVRFAYGLRIAGPVLMGAGPIGALRFATFNLIGAVLWAVLVGGIGWVFGQAAESLLGKLQRIEGWLLLGAVLAVGVV
ncbi:DedA family protein [Hydrogenophaga sp. OTU3427]|uniref:DedA family protein n=1 Tax=Hydrogenophaga sp. OTU3427 TaxID=3043856 RepID=UPI00313A93A5